MEQKKNHSVGSVLCDTEKISTLNVLKTSQDCEWNCIRISVNKTVFSSRCSAYLNFKDLKSEGFISYADLNKTCSISTLQGKIKRPFPMSLLDRIRYYVADDDEDEFSAKQRNEREKNDTDSTSVLDDVTNIFVMEFKIKKRIFTVVLELRSDEVFKEVLATAKKCKLANEESRLSLSQIRECASALTEDIINDERRRLKSLSRRGSITRNMSNGRNLKKENNLTDKKLHSDIPILIFPFTDESNVFDEASKSLTEAAGKSCRFENDDVVWFRESSSKIITDNTKNKHDQINEISKVVKVRSHYLTMSNEDLNRLDCGEFLNDTLIDFWMRW